MGWVVYIGSRVGRWWRSERPGDDDQTRHRKRRGEMGV
jgi:hypothetical protein